MHFRGGKLQEEPDKPTGVGTRGSVLEKSLVASRVCTIAHTCVPILLAMSRGLASVQVPEQTLRLSQKGDSPQLEEINWLKCGYFLARASTISTF